jgi:hypothetical protein
MLRSCSRVERRAVEKRIDGVVVPLIGGGAERIDTEWLWRRIRGRLDEKESALSREAEATHPKPGNGLRKAFNKQYTQRPMKSLLRLVCWFLRLVCWFRRPKAIAITR